MPCASYIKDAFIYGKIIPMSENPGLMVALRNTSEPIWQTFQLTSIYAPSWIILPSANHILGGYLYVRRRGIKHKSSMTLLVETGICLISNGLLY